MTTHAKFEEHLRWVEELLVAGWDASAIGRLAVEEGRCEHVDTARGWRRKIEMRWAEEEREFRPHRKNGMRIKLIRQMHKLEGYIETAQHDNARIGFMRTWNDLAALQIKLDGLDAPTVIKLEGARDPATMTPAERDVEIAELERKRQEFKRAQPVTASGEGGN